MNFVADESVEKHIVDRLRNAGHSILYITEISPSITDDEVLRRANHEHALLITSDRDFGELVIRQNLISHGTILIRLSGLSTQTKANMVVHTITNHQKEILGNFTVISPNRIRIRRIKRAGDG